MSDFVNEFWNWYVILIPESVFICHKSITTY